MDLVSKYRLVGATIWLILLVIIVPQWYSEPVNFVPEGFQQPTTKSTLPIVEHAYRLPKRDEQPLTNGQAQNQIEHQKQAVLTAKDSTNQTNVASQAIDIEKQKKLHQKLRQLDKVSDNAKFTGQWIVRLIAFADIKEANDLLGQLDSEYDVYIKYFERSKVYSVRVGPYISKAKAEKDKRKLDRMLHTKSEVVQLP
ncbi:SPOR domain-containing protein [Thiomicrorhabdus sp. Milos-T2]|uniref:SPOR domain-containing protein n=1 Tax=Thiomicrorhabdus sp. Milos-T2 TaxID=90814 RepID=UPI000493D37C|nr:SPOR domain-containing protein [Thiomicrorhabdus sp. Milos-T2]